MTDKEKNAIVYLEEMKQDFENAQKHFKEKEQETISEKGYFKRIIAELQSDIDNCNLILNLIEKQDKTIECYEETLEKQQKEIQKFRNMYNAEHNIHLVRNEQLNRKEIIVQNYNKLENQLKEKNEIIELMAQELIGIEIYPQDSIVPIYLKNKEEVKQYFEKEVSKDDI